MEVFVETFYDVGLFILKGGEEFIFGEGEESVIEFFPEHDATGREFVDWFAELRTNGDDATGRALVRLFPIFVVETRGIDNSLLSLYQLEKGTREGRGTAREVLASKAVITRDPKRTPSNGIQG